MRASRALTASLIALAACHEPEPVTPEPIAPSASAALPAVSGAAPSASAAPPSTSAAAPSASAVTPPVIVPAPWASAGPAQIAGTMACSQDDDCVVTTWAGCCGCCPLAPYPTSKADLEKRQAPCSRVRCMGCANVECPLAEEAGAYRALCKSGRCSAVRREDGAAPKR